MVLMLTVSQPAQHASASQLVPILLLGGQGHIERYSNLSRAISQKVGGLARF